MKKNLTPRVFPVLCVVAALAMGCGGSDDPSPQSCDSDADKYSAALSAYISDPTIAKCNAFKDAADDLLDCPGLTAGQRKEYEDAVDAIVCD